MSEWQSIESAPKDGSVFLAWRFYPIAVRWVDTDSDYPWEASMLGSSGVPMHANGIMDGDPSLTHWMPLPPRPAESQP